VFSVCDTIAGSCENKISVVNRPVLFVVETFVEELLPLGQFPGSVWKPFLLGEPLSSVSHVASDNVASGKFKWTSENRAA